MENEIEKLAAKEYPNWYTEYDEGRAYKGYIKGYKAALSSIPPGNEKIVEKFEKFLDTEMSVIGLSDKKTIERVKWYFQTYFKAVLSKGNNPSGITDAEYKALMKQLYPKDKK